MICIQLNINVFNYSNNNNYYYYVTLDEFNFVCYLSMLGIMKEGLYKYSNGNFER